MTNSSWHVLARGPRGGRGTQGDPEEPGGPRGTQGDPVLCRGIHGELRWTQGDPSRRTHGESGSSGSPWFTFVFLTPLGSLGRPLRPPGFSWVSLDPPGSFWVHLDPPGSPGSPWVALDHPGTAVSPWVLQAAPGSPWVPLGPPEYPCVSLDLPESPWVLLGPPGVPLSPPGCPCALLGLQGLLKRVPVQQLRWYHLDEIPKSDANCFHWTIELSEFSQARPNLSAPSGSFGCRWLLLALPGSSWLLLLASACIEKAVPLAHQRNPAAADPKQKK
jgi:hypothetical protein